jgi:hypothetical protein
MADINLVTAGKLNVGTLPVLQHTFIASEAITAGAPVYIVAATGKVANSDGNGSAPINTCFGVATRSAAPGEAVTVVRVGLVDGYDVSALNFGAKVYVSDSVGRIADAAGSTSLVVGTVVPANGAPVGTTADKIVLVQCNNSGT